MPNLKKMPNEIFSCQTLLKNAKFVKSGIEKCQLAALAETLTSFFRYLADPVYVVHYALVVGRAPPGGLGHELGAGVQVLAGGAGQVLRIHLWTRKYLKFFYKFF